MSAERTVLEEQVVADVRARRDELCDLVARLVAFDTTAREPGDPPRDEAALQALLAGRLAALGAGVDLWEPEPTGKGNRFVPDDLDFVGRPQLAATLAGAGGGRSLLLNGHIDAVDVEPRDQWSSDPLRGRRARGAAVRPRRERHEGRHRRPGGRPREPAARRRARCAATSSSAP